MLLAHKGEKHTTPEKLSSKDKTAIAGLKQTSLLYTEKIKPIFQKKCFDCHAIPQKLPWYAKIPGPKQLIAYDLREAKEHMDMRQDFPFGGHGSPLEDLKSLEEVVQNGSMPPWRYRIMHKGSKLTQEEIQKIQDWIHEGRKLIQP